ncbi:hypothetical protein LDO26_14315 [Luteimonas sp. BDR2-5]|uniref:hypothetical protein n=1 Tax=Proluteimonas luteida TaxID=2878685 RepID=UPI001E36D76D|nr:hypothetical protein [Luteimonas sp. BDR2-5]MCD9029369.1 hypothetical protein [Luteimonas sp. BDR2-5]
MAHGKAGRDWLPALLATLLLHGLALWWLWQQRDRADTSRAATALQVIWIERPVAGPPVPASPAPATAAVEAAAAPHRPVSVPTPAPAPRALQAVEIPAPPTDASPSAPSLHEQAREWVRAQAPANDFAPDPLRHRPPPAADGRFAMREPLSPQDVVNGIGALLFGGGPTDPCPQIRHNIASGDQAMVAEEIRRLQQFCL